MKLLIILYQHWNLFPIGLLQVNRLKKFLLLFTQMKIYSTLMKILVMSFFFFKEMRVLNKNINSNLDNNFDEDDSDTIIIRLKNISEELMPIVWHFWNFCMTEDEKKKKNRTDFYWVMLLMYTVWKY